MTIETIEIRNRVTNAVQVTAQIDCAPDAPISVKLGLAIRWAAGEKANLSGANLSGADLRGGNLSEANLSGANLSGADLRRAYLRGGNLREADLSGADLRGGNLSGANLSWANLSGGNLSWANLSWANLMGADLSGADLSEANLSWANLSGANLSGANLVGHKLTRFVGSASRSDGYQALCFDTKGGLVIRAGCRTFSLKEFKAHIASEYPNTPKAEETLRILKFLEAQSKQDKWV
jgi:hypothetical protein